MLFHPVRTDAGVSCQRYIDAGWSCWRGVLMEECQKWTHEPWWGMHCSPLLLLSPVCHFSISKRSESWNIFYNGIKKKMILRDYAMWCATRLLVPPQCWLHFWKASSGEGHGGWACRKWKVIHCAARQWQRSSKVQEHEGFSFWPDRLKSFVEISAHKLQRTQYLELSEENKDCVCLPKQILVLDELMLITSYQNCELTVFNS